MKGHINHVECVLLSKSKGCVCPPFDNHRGSPEVIDWIFVSVLVNCFV